jgi:DNA-binding NarL/FixJ family response regulator
MTHTGPEKIQIALIDDSARLRLAIGTYLMSHGFFVATEAANGQEFLDTVSTLERLPDICLLDTNMPVLDGYSTAVKLKATYPAIRIMAYSFFDDHESSDRMINCGADDYISKDASAVEIRDALLALFQRT